MKRVTRPRPSIPVELAEDTTTRSLESVLPVWVRGYRKAWLRPDVIAGVIVWSVVVPQAVAYAQIAGLPPSAGLVAAPGALVAYALIGTSRSLVVSATTATSALSAAAVAPLADGDATRFAALSAALALVAGAVLVGAGAFRLGGVMDLVSKPVMTGFLFGLGLTVTLGQLPDLLGLEPGTGDFFEKLWELISDLGDAHGSTVAVGLASVVALVGLRRFAPSLPGTLVVLVGSIVVSLVFDLSGRGVEVIGDLPSAFPTAEWPEFSLQDAAELLPAALGVMIVSAEAVGVARSIASAEGYAVDTNRDLIALGASNLAAGLSHGFVQSGGASQTMAADRAGGKTQVSQLVAAVLILATGLFLAPLFEDLPQATLAAIVIVAISGFFRADEIVRIGRLRESAAVLSLVALVGVLLFGVLPGLLLAAGLSLAIVIQRLSRPSYGTLGRDPASGVWGRIDRHPNLQTRPGVVVARVDGPLFYANAAPVKDWVGGIGADDPSIRVVVLDLSGSDDLDVGTLDMLTELADEFAARGVELRFAAVRAPVLRLLGLAGLAEHAFPSLDAAATPPATHGG